jgi:hypothetical protein
MKKFLLLLAVVVALFTTNLEMVKQPRDSLINDVIAVLSESTKVQRPSLARVALLSIEQQVELTPEQQAHLHAELANDLALRQFYQQYCKEREMSLYFFTDKLETICDLIERAASKTGTL